jgi:ketosteroid isomerase-like protein
MVDAHGFAKDWIAAWNARDLDRTLSLYADDIVLFSPHARERLGTGRIAGIAALRACWTAGMAALPDLRFVLQRVLVGHDCITVVYHNHRGQVVAETFEFGAANLIARSYACYAA